MEGSPVAPPAGTIGPSGPRASFGERGGAFLIDVILTWIVVLIWTILTARLETMSYVIGFAIYVAYFTYFEGSPSGRRSESGRSAFA